MKINLLKSFVFLIFLFLDFSAFAQGPGFGNEDGDLEEDDLPQANINGKLLWLVIIAVAYAYYTVKKKRSIEISK